MLGRIWLIKNFEDTHDGIVQLSQMVLEVFALGEGFRIIRGFPLRPAGDGIPNAPQGVTDTGEGCAGRIRDRFPAAGGFEGEDGGEIVDKRFELALLGLGFEFAGAARGERECAG